jgi:hypothetical protein
METEVHKFLSEVENSLIQLEKTGCLI